jgi:proteasome lid subunit RPN8/RPN11
MRSQEILASTFSESTEIEQTLDPDSPALVNKNSHHELELISAKFTGRADALVQHGELISSGSPRLFLSQLAIRRIYEHSQSDLQTELGGILLGRANQGADSWNVEILAALPVITDDHGPVHFTFTADSWAQLHDDRAIQYPDLDIVGWFHTHPDLGVFYSADDIVVHSAAFVMPWQVGLVIDPVSEECCFFSWSPIETDDTERKLAPVATFYEICDEQENSLTRWHIVPASTWTPEHYSGQNAEEGTEVYMPATEWPALPAISPWWGVLLGSLSLLISLILLLERIFSALR